MYTALCQEHLALKAPAAEPPHEKSSQKVFEVVIPKEDFADSIFWYHTNNVIVGVMPLKTKIGLARLVSDKPFFACI